jgi:hypothetical protein
MKAKWLKFLPAYLKIYFHAYEIVYLIAFLPNTHFRLKLNIGIDDYVGNLSP